MNFAVDRSNTAGDRAVRTVARACVTVDFSALTADQTKHAAVFARRGVGRHDTNAGSALHIVRRVDANAARTFATCGTQSLRLGRASRGAGMQTGIVDAPNICVDYSNDIGDSPDVAVDCRSVGSDRSNATADLTKATVHSADVALGAAGRVQFFVCEVVSNGLRLPGEALAKELREVRQGRGPA